MNITCTIIIYTGKYQNTIDVFKYNYNTGELKMIPIDSDIALLSFDEKLELRKKIQKQISTERRNKNLRIETFIPALRIHDFVMVRDWAFKQKFIPKNTNWAFTKFAVLNMIDLILTEMRTAEKNKQIHDQNMNNQIVPIIDNNVVYDSNIEPHTDT